MKLHPKTEPLRELLGELDKQPPWAKLTYARRIVDDTLTLLAETLHAVDRLEARVAALEAFPEVKRSH